MTPYILCAVLVVIVTRFTIPAVIELVRDEEPWGDSLPDGSRGNGKDL